MLCFFYLYPSVADDGLYASVDPVTSSGNTTSNSKILLKVVRDHPKTNTVVYTLLTNTFKQSSLIAKLLY